MYATTSEPRGPCTHVLCAVDSLTSFNVMQDYIKAKDKITDTKAAQDNQQNSRHGKYNQRKDSVEDPMTPKTQGALLLQSMLQLPAPHNQVVLDRCVPLRCHLMIRPLTNLCSLACSPRVSKIRLPWPTMSLLLVFSTSYYSPRRFHSRRSGSL